MKNKKRKEKKALDTIAFRIKGDISKEHLAYINQVYQQGNLSTFLNEAIELYIFYKTTQVIKDAPKPYQQNHKKDSIKSNKEIVSSDINTNDKQNNFEAIKNEFTDFDFENEIYGDYSNNNQDKNKNKNDSFMKDIIMNLEKNKKK